MSVRSPRLLFIARSFPPVATIASIRLSSVARHLARLGWEVHVLAPDPALMKSPVNHIGLEKLQTEGIKVIHSGMSGRCLLPAFFKQSWPWSSRLLGGVARKVARKLDLDDGIGWIKPALEAARVLQPGDIDLVLASGAPFSSFEIARKLAQRLRCPYVLDYRDPWTLRSFRDVPVRPWTTAAERRICAGAAAIFHVSPLLIPAHVAAFGGEDRNHYLSNGFDPQELDTVEPTRFEHRAIVYAGRFYPPHRIVEPVMRALALLRADPSGAWNDVYFHYYGPQSGMARQEAETSGLHSGFVDHGHVPQRDTFSATKGASVVVVVTSVATSAPAGILGTVSGKLFETIGLGSPLLLVATDGSTARDIVVSTRSGIGCPGDSPARIARVIAELLERGSTGRQPEADLVSWPTLIKTLDHILRSCLPVDSRG